MMDRPVVLAGAGAHAKGVVEALTLLGRVVGLYVDPRPAAWIEAAHETSDDGALPESGTLVLGLAGVAPGELQARLALLDRYLARGFSAEPVVHPSAIVSRSAEIGPGAIVLARAVVQPFARLERGALVNTGAIVEHDSTVGAGSHVAPGAIVLGACAIGAACMIGAGAVVLPGSEIPAGTLVAAATRYPPSAGLEARKVRR